MELITQFMDEMEFDGWTVYDPYGKGTHVGRDRHEYYLFSGTHSDELDMSVLDKFDKRGPFEGGLEFYLPEIASGKISIDDVRTNYAQYEDRIREKIKSDWLPKKTEYSGFGQILFRFDGGSVIIQFSGWSSDPIPDPIITRKEAVERAVEFARTDETLSGPRCGLDIPDRSVEDKPRYIRLTQFGGMPFWKVLMGPCETRHTIDELLLNHGFRALLRNYNPDVFRDNRTILLDGNGNIDLASIGIAPLDKRDQDALNYMHKIYVTVYVDATDGENTWFEETTSSYSSKLSKQTHSEDENVWFLEDGQAVFAEDWPKGYEEETFPLLLWEGS